MSLFVMRRNRKALRLRHAVNNDIVYFCPGTYPLHLTRFGYPDRPRNPLDIADSGATLKSALK